MKITLMETTIEAEAEELRECRTLSDCLVSFLKVATQQAESYNQKQARDDDKYNEEFVGDMDADE